MTRSEAAQLTAIGNVLCGVAETVVDGSYPKTPADFARLVQTEMRRLLLLAEPAMSNNQRT